MLSHYGHCVCVDWRELVGDGHRCVRAGQRALAIERLGRRDGHQQRRRLLECVLALARLGAVDRAFLQRQQRAPLPGSSSLSSSSYRSLPLHHQHVGFSGPRCAACGSTDGGSRAAAARAVALDGTATRERVRTNFRLAKDIDTLNDEWRRRKDQVLYFETIESLHFTEQEHRT